MRRLLSAFRGKTDNVWGQLVRYTIAGGLACVVDFAALYVMTELLHIHYLVSAALAFGLGSVTNYCTSTLWVFSKRAVQHRGLELAAFVFLGLIGLGINELVMYVCTDDLGLFFMYSKIVATGCTYVFNFASRKSLLFSPPAQDSDAICAQTAEA